MKRCRPAWWLMMAVALLLGFPVAFSVTAVGAVFGVIGVAAGHFKPAFLLAGTLRIEGFFHNDNLLAIPLFVFMGMLLERTGLAADMLRALDELLATVRGGMACTVVLVGATLAANNYRHVTEQFFGSKGMVETSENFWRHVKSREDDVTEKSPRNITIDSVAAFVKRIADGTPENHAIRGAESTFDISADLQELAHTPVAVVCAGIKSILDLALTREYLETHGVPLIGYGTDRLPAFYSRDSGHGVDARLDSPAELAAVLRAQWALGYPGGLVIANPVQEEHAMPRERIDAAIEQALAEAAAQGIRGKDSTPFLLARVAGITGGQSLAANIALVLNNARLAAQVAVAFAAG